MSAVDWDKIIRDIWTSKNAVNAALAARADGIVQESENGKGPAAIHKEIMDALDRLGITDKDERDALGVSLSTVNAERKEFVKKQREKRRQSRA